MVYVIKRRHTGRNDNFRLKGEDWEKVCREDTIFYFVAVGPCRIPVETTKKSGLWRLIFVP